MNESTKSETAYGDEQEGSAPESLSELAEQSPYKTTDAEVDFAVTPTRLRVGDQKFKMGICTLDDRPERGVREYEFRSGPYQVRVKSDSKSVHGTSWRIEVDMVEED
jgi:hypothetical protein